MKPPNPVDFAWRGALAEAEGSNDARAVLFARDGIVDPVVQAATAAIIARVRRDGDRALRELAVEHDGVDPSEQAPLEVPRDEWRRALQRQPRDIRRALERAVDNVGAVHRAFRAQPSEMLTADGVRIGRRPDPLGCVGVYAPGGRAAYPSSLVMGAVPARVAGVGEVIVCSPPKADSRRPSDLVLAAAALAGVDRVFAVGGAGAIAAMAFGTASVPRVDRVIGPGNAYVAAAKSMVAGVVGIDAPAGPSELLVIADAQASPMVVARELLAQAEHDPEAAVVCVLVSAVAVEREPWLRALDDALRSELTVAPRAEIMTRALARRGALLWTPDPDAAVRFASRWAPEHLLLALEPFSRARALRDVRHAGTIFLGERSSVAFGDYLTGANHVLPTGGAARAWSGLSPLDFVRWTTWQEVDGDAARQLADDVALLATAEGLPAHAVAAAQWRVGS